MALLRRVHLRNWCLEHRAAGRPALTVEIEALPPHWRAALVELRDGVREAFGDVLFAL
jgi:hypothetical protein